MMTVRTSFNIVIALALAVSLAVFALGVYSRQAALILIAVAATVGCVQALVTINKSPQRIPQFAVNNQRLVLTAFWTVVLASFAITTVIINHYHPLQ